jgi:hypothetical protein
MLRATFQHGNGEFATCNGVRDPESRGGDRTAVAGTENQDVILAAQRIIGCRQNCGCLGHDSNL